jgi:FkbM family methyltransferase
MKGFLKGKIKGWLLFVRLYAPVQKAYYRAEFFRRRTDLRVLGISKLFWTPTPSVYSDIRDSGGERFQLEEFIKHIREGDVVWDIGSSIGIYSLFASHVTGSHGKVYAFEPEPNSYNFLKRNCKLNKPDNLTLFNFAIGDVNSESYLYSSKNGCASHSLICGSNLSRKGVSVRIHSGDYLVEEEKVSFPNVVKIDVEGAECKVLSGMHRILSDPRCRFVLLEVHPKKLLNIGKSPLDIRSNLLDSGFTIIKEVNRGSEIHFLCSKSTI